MIWVTGDTHGDRSLFKLGKRRWPAAGSATEGDLVIVLGDFGLVWDADEDGEWVPSGRDRHALRWLQERPWTTLFVDGNHENHDLLDDLPTESRWGGTVGVLPGYDRILHLKRGEVYDLPDGDGGTARVLAFGGARSTDRQWRREGSSWWAREMPSAAEMAHARERLDGIGWEVDYVLTHDCPHRVKADLYRGVPAPDLGSDPLDRFLDELDGRLSYRRWYFGHHHVERDAGRHTCLFNAILRLGESVSDYSGPPSGPLVEPEDEGGWLTVEEAVRELALEGWRADAHDVLATVKPSMCRVSVATGRVLVDPESLTLVRIALAGRGAR